MNTPFLRKAAGVWLLETVFSVFNFAVLMNLVYEPRWGELAAHQIGMSTRILFIFGFAYLLLRFSKNYQTKDLFYAGFLWLGLELLTEWGGSLAMGRSVQEILIGWNIFAGYMWPYVLLTICSRI
ncbi:MAG TPA: hypothetical protein VMS94_05715 [Acidobacteriota bacterium]|nr:hypothetical protein [Acidobacteriota bacterium]